MDTNLLTQPQDPWHIAILIPARNEEALLPRCLHSIAAARALLPANVTSDVVVISDGSTDSTAALAQHILGLGGIVLSADAGCVGTARALAATVALTRNTLPLNQCWLANTDADCDVPATWLLDHLRIARSGITAVTGTVDVYDFSDHLPIVEQRFRETYVMHADGTHPHVHGANLGVRADAYQSAGGWSNLHTAEDHDLWHRLRAAGCTQLSDSTLQVITSGRRVGRAPLGFAGALAAHNHALVAA